MSVCVCVCVYVPSSSLNKYILSVFHVPDSVLCAGEIMMSITDILPFLLLLFHLPSVWPGSISKSTCKLKSLTNNLSLKNATFLTLISF